MRNKGTGKVVLWWANIRLWANQIRKVTSKYKVQHFPFFFDNKATLLLRCGGLPGNHQNDHVTFGCAGGATEFNVIQNNCNVTQGSKSPTKSSSKYESFLLFFGFLSRKRRKSRHVCQHTSLTQGRNRCLEWLHFFSPLLVQKKKTTTRVLIKVSDYAF